MDFAPKNDLSNQPIAIIGLGCRYPGAENPAQLWENILARRQGFRRMPDCRLPLDQYHDPDPKQADKTYHTRAAVLEQFVFDWQKNRIPKSTVESTDVVHWLALDVALQALQDAGYASENLPRGRTGVIVGNSLTGEQQRATTMRVRWPFVAKALRAAANQQGLSNIAMDKLVQTTEQYFKSVFLPMNEDTLAGSLSNTIAGRVCNHLDLQGGGYTVDGACASSLLAVISAIKSLAIGELDVAFAGGVDVSLDTFELVGFARTGALSSTEMRVYDQRANGFLPGEGCGFVILKRLQDARRDGDYIHAVLRGWGISSDGKGGITAPKVKTQAMALRRAYERAGYGMESLDFIEGHGTGTPLGDKTELGAIALAMQSGSPVSKRHCGVTSFKSLVGHTKAAAGVGGLIKAVLAVNHRVIPPTVGCQRPHAIFETEAQSLYPVVHGEVRKPTETLRAAVSAMGFGGINSHVTLESGDLSDGRFTSTENTRHLLAHQQTCELILITADSLPLFLERIRQVQALAHGLSMAELADLSAHLLEAVSKQSIWRAAWVVESPEQLVDWLNQAHIQLSKKSIDDGEKYVSPCQRVWMSHDSETNSPPCRVGFMFPGQGASTLGMARLLVQRFDWAQQLVDQTDRWLQDVGSKSVRELLFRDGEKAESLQQRKAWRQQLAETEIAQPAITLVSLLWLQYLRNLGVQPTFVVGHSLGELAAFHAADAFDAETLIKLAAQRGQAMAQAANQSGYVGAMASLQCTPETVASMLEPFGGTVVISNHNSSQQVVISGLATAVEQVVQQARSEGIVGKLLDVPAAFHSSQMQSAAERLQQHSIVPETPRQLGCTLFSSMTGRPIDENIELRNHLAEQVRAPVRFASLVPDLKRNCDLLIEVGPGKVLSGFIQEVQGSNAPPALPIESKVEEDTDRLVLLGALFVHGVPWRLENLHAHRLIRPFVAAQYRKFIENPCERPFEGSISSTGSQTELLPFRDVLETPESPETAVACAASDCKSGVGDAEGCVTAVQKDSGEAFQFESTDSDLPMVSAVLESVSGTSSVSVLSQAETSPGQDALSTDLPTDASAVADIESCFHGLVADKTGFPRGTLQNQHRLLDDLHLDSIKTAELVSQASQTLQIEGQLDPMGFADASVGEVVDALLEAQKRINNSGESQEPSRPSGPQSKSALSWVRNYSIQPTIAPWIPPTISEVGQTFANQKILILHLPTSTTAMALARSLQSQLTELGAQVDCQSWTGELGLPQTEETSINHLIALLPVLDKTVLQSSEACRANLVCYQRIAEHLGRLSQPSTMDPCVTLLEQGLPQSHAWAASLHLENPQFKVRRIHWDAALPIPQQSERTLQEMVGPGPFVSVDYDSQFTRWTPQATVQNPGRYSARDVQIQAGDVVLVTGGARGITAQCARALAETTGARLALVGRSPHPDEGSESTRTIEVRDLLNRLRQSGIDANYYACDVTDKEDTRRLIARVQTELGPVAALVHGAGNNEPQRINQSHLDQAVRQFSPKVIGMQHLLQGLSEQPDGHLKQVVGLTSIIGVTGMQGNAWYGLSNQWLDQMLGVWQTQHPEAQALSLAYSVWDEVGMGVSLGSVDRLASMGIDALSPAQGVERFIDLFRQDPGVRQVVVAARLNNLDTWPIRPVHRPDASRFLEEIITGQRGIALQTRTKLDVQRDSYLLDHNYQGSLLFPTVMGLEAMGQATACVLGLPALPRPLRIQNVNLPRPISVDPKDGLRIEIRAVVQEEQSLGGPQTVQAEIYTAQDGFTEPHFSAQFLVGETEGSVLEPEEPLQVPSDAQSIDAQEHLYGGLLFQGPRFQRLETVLELSERHCLFQASLQERNDTVSIDSADRANGPWILGDPYLRDALLQSVQPSVPQDLCLPISIKKHTLYRLPKRTHYLKTGVILGKAVIESRKEQVYHTHILACHLDSSPVERLEGYQLRVMQNCPDHPTVEQLKRTTDKAVPSFEQRTHQAATILRLNEKELLHQPPFPKSTATSIEPTLCYQLENYGCQNQDAFAYRFPLTAQDSSSVGRRLYFTKFFSWMGKLREICGITTPNAYVRILDMLGSNRITSATNAFETYILGSPRCNDLVEGRFWAEKVTAGGSDAICEWWRIPFTPNEGKPEMFGWSRMRMSSVEVLKSGEIKSTPWPTEFYDFLCSMGPRINAKTQRPMLSRTYGEKLFSVPSGPKLPLQVFEQMFETSLEDSNVVGNIYFANYGVWQGRVREHFFHRIASDHYDFSRNSSEIGCDYCKINQLREAMPFDKVLVTLHIDTIFECAAKLVFQYFRVDEIGLKTKIAVGEQTAVWMTQQEGVATMKKWPSQVLANLLRIADDAKTSQAA